MRSRLPALALTALCLAGSSPAGAAPAPATGFDQPESATWDPKTQAWYVSNTAGGYVTKLDADGAVVEERWLDDLHGPYGIDAQGGSLFVSDTDRVVVADLGTAEIEREIPFEDAGLLNDLTVDRKGNAFVSDTCAGEIHRIARGSWSAQGFVSLPADGPNGLDIDGSELVVAGLGAIPGVCGDPSSVGGRVLTVNLKTKKVTPVTGPIGALDGLEVDGDRYLVTDFVTGRLIAVDAATGASTVLAPGLPTAADLGFDPATRVVAIPHSFANAVFFHDV